MSDRNEAFLTPAEVANLLGVSPVTVRAWAARGLFANRLTPGGHRRFARCEVERFALQRGMSRVSTSRLASRRALLVVDDPHCHRLLGDFLAQHGVEILSAVDGFAAGFQFVTLRPDLVFLSASMPGIDSLALCCRIKSDPTTSATRIVVIDSQRSATRRAQLRLAGVECCVETPPDLDLLARQLAFDKIQTVIGDDH